MIDFNKLRCYNMYEKVNEKVNEKEADSMTFITAEYNKDIFLHELEESLKEMKENKKNRTAKNEQSSWRDLFAKEKD